MTSASKDCYLTSKWSWTKSTGRSSASLRASAYAWIMLKQGRPYKLSCERDITSIRATQQAEPHKVGFPTWDIRCQPTLPSNSYYVKSSVRLFWNRNDETRSSSDTSGRFPAKEIRRTFMEEQHQGCLVDQWPWRTINFTISVLAADFLSVLFFRYVIAFYYRSSDINKLMLQRSRRLIFED